MKHPRVVFVPDEELPYDASTFARFNAEQQKKQSKPEHAVKLGKIVPDNVFTSITNDISRFDRMSCAFITSIYVLRTPKATTAIKSVKNTPRNAFTI